MGAVLTVGAVSCGARWNLDSTRTSSNGEHAIVEPSTGAAPCRCIVGGVRPWSTAHEQGRASAAAAASPASAGSAPSSRLKHSRRQRKRSRPLAARERPGGQWHGCVTPSGAGLLTIPGTLHPVPRESRLWRGGTPRPVGAWSQFALLDPTQPRTHRGWRPVPRGFPDQRCPAAAPVGSGDAGESAGNAATHAGDAATHAPSPSPTPTAHARACAHLWPKSQLTRAARRPCRRACPCPCPSSCRSRR